MRKGVVFILSLVILFSAKAQTPQTMNSAEILLGLKKLKVIGSVLYVAAHPDDENTRLLAYFSKERLYRTGYLSMTRGDGGQNLIGDEQGIELGLIRTQELLAARRIDGAEQFFTRAYDFGFSKTTEEALSIWDKEKILSDVVWVIRKFQPDVIITRFPPDNRAGHGHHSASAVLAREAFDAAADPNRFPEQFKYAVKPWKTKRIFWNTYNFGGNNTTSNDQLKLDVGAFNPLLGKGYGEIASESRSMHKSQGFGVPAQRGTAIEFFTQTGGETVTQDIAEGIVNDWSRFEGGSLINKMIDEIVATYSFQNPSASVKSLVDLYKAIEKINDGDWKIKKLNEVKALIEACAGLFLEAVATEQYAVQGDSLHVNITAVNRNAASVQLISSYLNNEQDALVKVIKLQKDILYRDRINIAVPNSKPLSQPYWLVNINPKGAFDVADQKLIGRAENDASYSATFILNIHGETFQFEKPVMYKFTDPVRGEIYQPLVVVPAITAKPLSNLVTRKNADGLLPISIVLKANRKINFTNLALVSQIPPANKLGLNPSPMSAGEARIEMAGLGDKNFVGDVSFFVDHPNSPSLSNWHNISYDHIPSINYFDETTVHVFKLDVKTAGKNIGYIKGAGDKVAEGLMQMGYAVSFLDENDITVANLKQYDAVVTGIRAYNVHAWLSNAYDALMEYVKEGGVLLVQYNTSNQIGPVRSKISPYPFAISRNRVTEEHAKVNFLAPDHVVLNYPNKITENDFEGWVQERSVYEADNIDAKFTSLFGMNDAGEPQRNGSLIVADYGKGRFVYSALAFFRQLPAGVPGSYRLIANLLAKPNK